MVLDNRTVDEAAWAMHHLYCLRRWGGKMEPYAIRLVEERDWADPNAAPNAYDWTHIAREYLSLAKTRALALQGKVLELARGLEIARNALRQRDGGDAGQCVICGAETATRYNEMCPKCASQMIGRILSGNFGMEAYRYVRDLEEVVDGVISAAERGSDAMEKAVENARKVARRKVREPVA